MTRGQLRFVLVAFGVALGSAAGAQEWITTVLPPGCQVRAAPDQQALCEPQAMVFDVSGMTITADGTAPVRTMAGAAMGTFGLSGPIGVTLPGGDDAMLIALGQRDITETGSIRSQARGGRPLNAR